MPDAAFSASSIAGSKNGPERARLNVQGSGAWVAKANNGSQWLQIDLGELVRVTKVATQGRRDADHWVTQFSHTAWTGRTGLNTRKTVLHGSVNRINHCLQTLFLLFIFLISATKEYFV